MYVWGEIYESPGKYKGVASSVLLATLLMRYILQFDEFFDARVLFFLQKNYKKNSSNHSARCTQKWKTIAAIIVYINIRMALLA